MALSASFRQPRTPSRFTGRSLHFVIRSWVFWRIPTAEARFPLNASHKLLRASDSLREHLSCRFRRHNGPRPFSHHHYLLRLHREAPCKHRVRRHQCRSEMTLRDARGNPRLNPHRRAIDGKGFQDSLCPWQTNQLPNQSPLRNPYAENPTGFERPFRLPLRRSLTPRELVLQVAQEDPLMSHPKRPNSHQEPTWSRMVVRVHPNGSPSQAVESNRR